MKAECERLGVTPLSEEEFRREDARMYTDLMRRRQHLPPEFSVYR
jgi:hypothetical protein